MMSDGSMEMIRPDGKAVYFGGAGQSTSSGETRCTDVGGFSLNRDQSVRHETQEMESETATRSQTFDKSVSQGADALYTVMQSAKTDNGYNIDTSTEEGKEVVQHLNEIDRLSKTNDYGWRQNAESYLRADYTAGGAAAKALGFDVGGGGKMSAENNSSQSDSHSTDIQNDTNLSDRKSNTERVNKMESVLESHGVDKNTQNSMRENYQEVERLDQSIAQHKSNIDSHNKTMSFAENNSSEMSKDITQDVGDNYQKLYGGSAREAHEAVSKKTDKAQEAFRDFTSAKYQEKFNEIKSQGMQMQNSNKVGDFASNNQIDSTIGGKRDKWAGENNINTQTPGQAEQEIANKGTRIKNLHEQKSTANNSEYDNTNTSITKEQKARNDQIKDHEDNRLGTGKVAKGVGEVLDFVSEGHAGKSIGRSPVQKDNLDLGDPIGKPYEPKGGTYDLKTKEFTPFPKGHKPRFEFNETSSKWEKVNPKIK